MPRPRKAKLVELPNKFSKPPHKCLVSGRTDAPVVDFGVDYTGIDPHIYIRASRVEEAATDVLGMVPAAIVEAMQERLDAAERENARLGELVGAAEGLEAALERVKAAFEPDPDPSGDPSDETPQQEA